MRDAQAKTNYLKDYRVPDFLIDSTELHFQLGDAATLVRSKLAIRRNPEANTPDAPLVLDGQELMLKRLLLDGQALSVDAYRVDSESLAIDSVPDQFVLECVTMIKPQENTSLEGLYKSHKMYCTQCEAEGFRKITYYLDRPDVMSSFTTTIVASKEKFPVLLSNGNEIDSGDLENGDHWVSWQDPFKKPCYLFALVAGDLEFVEDSFTTMSGRVVKLRIFVETKDLDKCDHAMRSLKKAMRWDEEVYGREYDLDIFMIVAVDDFNMGAMENKGLNIFNTSCVLANPQTTTDAGFQRVEGVVAHEYFHNWSGNRVTCRDWFQLSLKEGFTVFRDAEFSADMNSRTVKRVEDVMLLRTMQFAEDAGPMAHPVRPQSYMEISNFYTLTVYEKGAEVVRMIHQLLGAEDFRKGSDLYFDRHDGQAVTCDDFVQAMEDASGKSLARFKNWYHQAGTPVLDVKGEYNENAKTYTLTVKQSCPATPGQPHKEPFHIPLAMGLLGDAGSLPLKLKNAPLNIDTADNTYMVLDVIEREEKFVFCDVMENPVPSLLRGFSAPVKLNFNYSRDDLLFLMQNDSDGFSRWNACQQLALELLQELVVEYQQGKAMSVDFRLVDAYSSLLQDRSLDPAMVALMLTLPGEAYLAEEADEVDVAAIHYAREFLRHQLAENLCEQLHEVYQQNQTSIAYQPSAEQIAKRSLKNVCLAYLMLLERPESLALCQQQFKTASNMTDRLAALSALVNCQFAQIEPVKQQALVDFYQQWKSEPLVVNQWFQVQSACRLPGTLDVVKSLMKHEAFDFNNPNKLRAVIAAFSGSNAINFHQSDGAGYQFLADQIIKLDKSNPQIASRLLTPLTKWKKFPLAAQNKMQQELQRIMEVENLSMDVYEVVSKSLN